MKMIKSDDGTIIKFFIPLFDYVIEMVLVEREEKNIICFPSQIGCPLKCNICKSKPFKRDIAPLEIYNAIKKIIPYITDSKIAGRKKGNLASVNKELEKHEVRCPICMEMLEMTEEKNKFRVLCFANSGDHKLMQKEMYNTPHDALKHLEIQNFTIYR